MSAPPDAAKVWQFTIVELIAVMFVVVILAAAFRAGSEQRPRLHLDDSTGQGTSGLAPKRLR